MSNLQASMVKFLFVLIVSVFVLAATSFAKPASLDDWVQEQKVYSFERIHKILGTADKPYAGVPYGAVIASPSQSDPNYFYHWVRDAALVMASLDQYSGDQSESRRNENVFNAFARRVKIHQESAKISDLGEPKFYLDGRGYSEPWGRPQNDGPALRALFLMQRANKLLQQGKTQAVKESFFNEGLPATTLVKRDLEYVSHQWRNPDFDLWEEVKGQHFYTRMVQMLALRKGSEFAAKLGEPLAARWYAEQAKEIKDSIAQHHRGPYIKSHIIRVGGLDYKESSLDASVLLAFNHTKINPLLWDGLTEKYWQTFTELWQSFGSIYKINHNLPGVVFGRYPEDQYYGGNPWFLLTAAAAESLYRHAAFIKANSSSVGLTPELRRFAKIVFGMNSHRWGRGETLSDELGSKLAQAMIKTGDILAERLRLHASDSGQMDEQIDRYTGFNKSAKHLTWSYAAFITMAEARQKVLQMR